MLTILRTADASGSPMASALAALHLALSATLADGERAHADLSAHGGRVRGVPDGVHT
jgi:hypothetical protein